MLTFWAYLRFHLLLWALRAAWRVLRWLVTAAVLVAAAPITVVAAVAFAGAWLRGWPPAKLWRAAAWSLPMTGVYLAARALHARILARPGRRAVPRLAACLAPGPARPGPGGVCAVRPGGGARGAVRSGHCVGVADLRHRNRHHREDSHRPGRVRREAVAAAGPHRPRPHHRPRHRPAHRPAGPGGDGRHHPHHRPPLAPDHCHRAHRDGPASGRHRRVRQRGRRT